MVTSVVPPDSSSGGADSGGENSNLFARDITFNGGGAPLFDLDYIDLEVPFDCTIDSVTLTSAASGTVALDLQTTTYTLYPNSFTSLIGSGTAPSLSSTYRSTTTDFSDWGGSTLGGGDILRVLIDGNATIVSQLTVSIRGTAA